MLESGQFQSYLRESHNPYYSIVATLPLLIAYELLLAITSHPHWQVRNAADVWLRKILATFDLSSQQATIAMILILLVLIPVVRRKYAPLKRSYFAYMFLETIVYSLCLGLVINLILRTLFLATPMSGGFLQNIALSLGAGLFEEFAFRVILLNALFFGLKPILKNVLLSASIAIFMASFLFSLSHYVGNLSDPFDFYSFIFRWMAGLLFTVIYFLRGFAVAAYTHAFYDIWVVL